MTAMRSAPEIQAMILTLERFNQAAEQAIRAGRDIEENMGVFNGNAKLLCALRWTLGEETMSHTVRTP